MSGNPYYYYNDPSLYAGQSYPSYTLPTTSPHPAPVLNHDAIRQAVRQHPKAPKKDHTQAWIIGGLTALGVVAIAIWQRKALSQMLESVFKHEKPPSVDIPKRPSPVKEVEETITEEIPKKAREPRTSRSSGGSPPSNPEPPSEPTRTDKPTPEPAPTKPTEHPSEHDPTPPIDSASTPPSRASVDPMPEPAPAVAKATSGVNLSSEVQKLVEDFNSNREKLTLSKFYQNNPGKKMGMNILPNGKIIGPIVSESMAGILYKIDNTELVFLGSSFRPEYALGEAGEEIQHLFEIRNPKSVTKESYFSLNVLQPARVDTEGNLIEKGILEVI